MAEAGVNRRHKQYGARAPQWERCRDVIEGTDQVKGKGTNYLPRLTGQTRIPDPGGVGAVDEYESYKMRATFFGATARTVQGLLGLVFRKVMSIEPEPEEDEVMGALTNHATAMGETMEALAQRLVNELLSVGRAGLLVEYDDELGQPYLCSYRTECIVNWRIEMVGAQDVLTQVVLMECDEEPDPDGFGVVEVEQYRVLQLGADPLTPTIYTETIWRKAAKSDDWMPVKTMTPLRRGAPLDFIPFIFLNSCNQLPDPEKPPLLDLVDLNLAHYRNNADYEHGVHYTALPTAWVAGFNTGSELRIGSGTAWVTDNTAAKAGFLEFTGQGLGALREAILDKERQMAVIGARMLEGQKREAETAEALRIRQAGDSATLGTVAQSVSNGLTTAAQYALWWAGVGELDQLEDEVKIQLNFDYVESTVDSKAMLDWMMLVQEGFMSKDTFHWLAQQGEMLPPGRTIDEEQQLIAEDASKRDVIPPAPRDRGVQQIPPPMPADDEQAA